MTSENWVFVTWKTRISSWWIFNAQIIDTLIQQPLQQMDCKFTYFELLKHWLKLFSRSDVLPSFMRLTPSSASTLQCRGLEGIWRAEKRQTKPISVSEPKKSPNSLQPMK